VNDICKQVLASDDEKTLFPVMYDVFLFISVNVQNQVRKNRFTLTNAASATNIVVNTAGHTDTTLTTSHPACLKAF